MIRFNYKRVYSFLYRAMKMDADEIRIKTVT